MSKLDSLKNISSNLEKVSKTKKAIKEKSEPLVLSKIGVDKLETRELIDNANNGDITALTALGIQYLTGVDVDKDYVLAKKIFEKCCEEKVSHAFFGLGMIYEYGYDVDIDITKAYDCYSKGASLNSPECLYKKGLFLLNGLGVDQDINEALNTFKKGATGQNANCLFALANMYDRGIGVEQNEKTALNYFHLATELGHEDAICTLAIKFIEGKSLEKNISKAIELLESIADNNSDALYLLGSLYLSDDSIRNVDKALSYLKEASNLQNPGASYLLAHLYRDGFKHIEPNMLISRKYYKLASEQGDINAKVEITFFNRNKEGNWFFDHDKYNQEFEEMYSQLYNEDDSETDEDSEESEQIEDNSLTENLEPTYEENEPLNSEENEEPEVIEENKETKESHYRNLYEAETISLDDIKVAPEFDELIKPTDINDK